MPPPSGQRDPIAGPDTPEPPFPLKLRGEIIRGFGRGSKELGIPTANIPITGLSINGHSDLSSGIYYGWAGLDFLHAKASPSSTTTTPPSHSSVADLESRSTTPLPITASPTSPHLQKTDTKGEYIYPMVMSLGYNPFYKNTVRSVEVHIMHTFPSDFYGAEMSLLVLGFIRPEYDYVSKEALIEDIRTDILVARRSLERERYVRFREDGWLRGAGEGGQVERVRDGETGS